jgi:hypothetical protein
MPIRGVDPQLVLMPGGALVLARGRPHCTIHFSPDRGVTWPQNEVLFSTSPLGAPDRYTESTCNPELAIVDDCTLLYIHDAARADPSATNHWLKRHGFGRMVGRLITLEKITPASPIDPPAEMGLATMQEKEPPVALAAKRQTDPKRDERFWEGVRSYNLSDSETGKPPLSATSFRVAWADNALYLSIRCEDRDMNHINITAREKADTNLWKGDCIEVLIQTQLHTYYQIAINPAGAIVDVDRKDGLNLLWSSGVEIAAHLRERFWSLDVRVPLAETFDPLKGIVGRMPSETDPWRFNLCRQRVRGDSQEISAFSPTGYPWFHELTRFGKLYVE